LPFADLHVKDMMGQAPWPELYLVLLSE